MCLVQADMDAEVVGIAIPRRTEELQAGQALDAGFMLSNGWPHWPAGSLIRISPFRARADRLDR